MLQCYTLQSWKEHPRWVRLIDSQSRELDKPQGYQLSEANAAERMTGMIRKTEHQIATSGSLAFDLLEHQTTVETLLVYHTSISSALARCPSAELRQLFEDTINRLATTFATMEHILDAHEYGSAHTRYDTCKAWRVAIERLKERHNIRQPALRPAQTATSASQPVRLAA